MKDISAFGAKYPIIKNGKMIIEFGTSASTPVFAAMVTLWNDIRLKQVCFSVSIPFYFSTFFFFFKFLPWSILYLGITH